MDFFFRLLWLQRVCLLLRRGEKEEGADGG